MPKTLKELAMQYGLLSGYERIHDTEVLHLNTELSFEQLEQRVLALYAKMDTEATMNAWREISGYLPAPEPTIDFTPVFVDCPRQIGSVMSDEQAKKIAEEMQRIYKEALGTIGDSTSRIIDSINKFGYIETPYGRRRCFSRKSSMDSNDTVRGDR